MRFACLWKREYQGSHYLCVLLFLSLKRNTWLEVALGKANLFILVYSWEATTCRGRGDRNASVASHCGKRRIKWTVNAIAPDRKQLHQVRAETTPQLSTIPLHLLYCIFKCMSLGGHVTSITWRFRNTSSCTLAVMDQTQTKLVSFEAHKHTE